MAYLQYRNLEMKSEKIHNFVWNNKLNVVFITGSILHNTVNVTE